eukprot:jgi/Mesvir1/25502/Mv01756-RA.2
MHAALDCCDGSDEYAGRITCANTCRALGEVARQALRREVDLYEKGVIAKAQMVATAEAKRKQWMAEVAEAVTTLKDVSETLATLKVEKDHLEELERVRLEAVEAERAAREKEAAETAQQQQAASGEGDGSGDAAAAEHAPGDEVHVPEDLAAGLSMEDVGLNEEVLEEELTPEERGRRIAAQWTHEFDDQVAADEHAHVAAHREHHVCTAGADGDASKCEHGASAHASHEEPEAEPLDGEYVEEDYLEEFEEGEYDEEEGFEEGEGEFEGDEFEDDSVGGEEHAVGAHESTSLRSLAAAVATRLKSVASWISTVVFRAPGHKDADAGSARSEGEGAAAGGDVLPSPELDKLRQKYQSLETDKRNLESRISEVDHKLEYEYGPDDVFLAMEGQCYDLQTHEYTYQVCPFDKVVQKSRSGGSTVTLGQWERWDKDFGAMIFANGETCWNGPARSMRVTLECDAKVELRSVDEPSRCEYAAVMGTPAKCDPAHAQMLRMEVEMQEREDGDEDAAM